ncbi:MULTISPECIES: hypothetical protein [Stenotrophomonas]|jgi:hypothetical protein|uniref:Lipoprotein n=1 Tax=Stenotrophomonas maltophilia TaxID=40324 RepID=A0AAP7GPM6_STEMA|nr:MULTISPECIES: hypothetical protein [Stenotrophomonas]KOQ69602.1 hypothetical protein ABW43_08890 [Stenotrophomonas maltophilia]MBE5271632.1 hypothetical protein [Stenotrophomonas sp. B2]MBH1591973.1 hypothetical protein [Stenotrophomonas maltophilia]MCU1090426.1 hypothetical protein [Stenotrophomonas maltophilia]MDH0172083.1 hypothetical protein [Stenotrophomonas sp. GD04145]
MKIEAAWAVAVLAVGAAACAPVARADSPGLAVLRSEDGLPANRYTSQHQMSCGSRVFELVVESPGPVRLTGLKVDGVAVPAAQLQAINAQVPERSWFQGIASSCTSARQSLTLQLSSPQGAVTIPLSFKDGVLVPAAPAR